MKKPCNVCKTRPYGSELFLFYKPFDDVEVAVCEFCLEKIRKENREYSNAWNAEMKVGNKRK